MIHDRLSIATQFVAVVIVAMSIPAHAADVDSILNSTTTTVQYSDETPWEISLSNWGDKIHMPVGLLIDGDPLKKPGAHLDTVSLLHDIHTPPTYHLHTNSPRAMLDLICSDNPDYQWRVVKGVINILPRDMTNDHMKPLNNTVTQFHMREQSFKSALRGLFRQQGIPLQVSGLITGSLSYYKSNAPIDYLCENVTVLECVNILGRSAGHSWQIVYRPDIQSFYIESSGMPFFSPKKK